MGSYAEIRIVLSMFASGLIASFAYAGDPMLIRGDQSPSLIAKVPVEMKTSPEEFSLSAEKDLDGELRKLLADIELFTAEPASPSRVSAAPQLEKQIQSQTDAKSGDAP